MSLKAKLAALSVRCLPGWLQAYPRQHLAADVLAGMIVTILVLPQSLAYALLAGLPPQAGLYVSIFPVIAYALLGSSQVQAVGPVAITAIMTFSILSPLAKAGTGEYLVLAASLSLLSGLMLCACGLLRLGFLAQLLSRPVISGFISGSAILIIISQIKYLLGVASGGSNMLTMLAGLWTHLGETQALPLLFGLSSLIVLSATRVMLAQVLEQFGLKKPSAAFIVRLMPLVVVLLGTACVAYWELDAGGKLAVVGQVAAGIPGFTWFLPSLPTVHQLLVPAVLMALVGMVQGISMAQALAIKRREKIDANAELLGLGAANVVAAFYGGMPVGGGVSRSAVNVAAGAQTPLASLISAVAMWLIVAGAATAFTHLPLAILAASIMVAAASMIDVAALRQTWAYDRADAYALLGTAGGVLLLGLEGGIALGIVFSLVTLVFRASTPHIAVVGRIANSEHFRNINRHEVETLPQVVFLRIDESLFFGNLQAVETRIRQEISDRPATKHLVLILSAVNRMDSTAMETLFELNRDLLSQGIRLHFAEVKGPVQDRLQHSPLWQTLSGKIFLSANQAFVAFSTSQYSSSSFS